MYSLSKLFQKDIVSVFLHTWGKVNYHAWLDVTVLDLLRAIEANGVQWCSYRSECLKYLCKRHSLPFKVKVHHNLKSCKKPYI